MPEWAKIALFVLCLGGLVIAFVVARQKGVGRFNASMSTARAEGAADLRAQLGQHVNVSVDNSRRVHSPGGSSEPVTVSELARLEVARLRQLRDPAALNAAAGFWDYNDDDRATADDYDDAGGGDDDDYHLALSRALDHDDGTTGYDSAVYASAPGRPRSGGAPGERGIGPDPHLSAGGDLRAGDSPRQIVVRRPRGPGR